SLSAYFPEMVFTDSGITVQLHRNTQMMGNTEVTLPEGRMLAASLRFDPVQQVLDAPRARLLSFSGEVLGQYRDYHRPLR
ncbi:hypothetical protein, partial [Aeromonas caviae]|uniref:hypothetical protein n=1 Tax=Aeromonas caviae TaxID=648 RepID=UPI003F7463D3